jgi:hypothetical protein
MINQKRRCTRQQFRCAPLLDLRLCRTSGHRDGARGARRGERPASSKKPGLEQPHREDYRSVLFDTGAPSIGDDGDGFDGALIGGDGVFDYVNGCLEVFGTEEADADATPRTYWWLWSR